MKNELARAGGGAFFLAEWKDDLTEAAICYDGTCDHDDDNE